ncbi:hypothetical protein VSDG_07540 [Cytospora chrysosperma]|uniref:Major facilitator superfamily (MFS) profile domain-containing protein n=1 Tax=Cytospora chrysosperma TaxID=252740 RepID=A0A423VMG2_CYTCH|nr:hypothetical protein VSDG_07540 [Valsa sordida]
MDNTSPPPPPPVRWLDLPNKTQLFILALCRLSEPLSNASLLPYIFHLVRSVLPDDPATNKDAAIPFYSGLLAASFPLAQFAVSLPCGYLSDRQGRRASIVTGLFVSAVANAAFGFCGGKGKGKGKGNGGIAWLFAWRVLAGMANGNVAIMRTATAEIVRERRFQTKAFLLLPLVFNSGMVVSMALGGVLADPVVNLPGLFGPGGALNWGGGEDGVEWMAEYPFALPALMNALVLGFVLVLAVFGLRETLPGKEGERDWGIAAGERIVQLVKGVGISRRKEEASYKLLDDVEDQDLGQSGQEDIQLYEAKPSVATPAAGTADDDDDAAAAATVTITPTTVKREPALPFRQIWTRHTVAAMVSFGLLPLHNSAFMHIFPVFLSSPPDHHDGDVPPPPPSAFPAVHFTGGLGLPPRTIGLSLGALGVCGILFQLYLYPRWQARAGGTLGVLRASLLMFPVAYAVAPFLSAVQGQTSPLASSWKLLLWPALAAVAWAQVMARTMAIPSTVMLLTEAAPSPRVLGTVHGAGNMLASLARAVGPAAGGWVYAWGVRRGMVGAVWWFYLDVAALVALAWGFGVQRERRPHDETSPGHERRAC